MTLNPHTLHEKGVRHLKKLALVGRSVVSGEEVEERHVISSSTGNLMGKEALKRFDKVPDVSRMGMLMNHLDNIRAELLRINSQTNQVYSCVRCSVIVTVSVCLRVSNIHIMITCVLRFYCVFHGYCATTLPTPNPTHRL